MDKSSSNSCNFTHLKPWDEVIGIIHEVTKIKDSISIALFIPSIGIVQHFNIPNDSILFNNVLSRNKMAIKVGILKVSENPEHYRIRTIEGGK